MNLPLIQKLRERLQSRKLDSNGRYWDALRRLLDEPKSEKLLAQIEELLPLVGRTPDDVERDVALLADLREKESCRQEAASAMQLAESRSREGQKAEAEAAEARERASKLTERAEELMRSARQLGMDLQNRTAELLDSRHRLLAVGHPAFPTLSGAQAEDGDRG